MNYTAVITTINEPTKAVKEFAKRIPLIVIGDEKTPKDWECEGVLYCRTVNDPNLSYHPPINHYARKNLGYLLAMQGGADCIYDTDDDNIPNENWKLRERECRAMSVKNKGWVNVYNYLSNHTIWPRGLPLTVIDVGGPLSDPVGISSPIHQGLSDLFPDVDAVWRLTRNSKIWFSWDRRIYLPPGTWSPFNSQTTWWFKEAFPLMYLPQYCTMRMTDIVRSFVAQRCLWEMGYGVVFHSPSEVVQERNEHDLMKDFEDEIQGYLMNDKIKIALDGLELGYPVLTNMLKCYTELIDIGVLPPEEYTSLCRWITDIEKVWTV